MINNRRLTLIKYAVTGLLLLGGLALWHYAYQQNRLALNEVKAALTHPVSQEPLWLSQLNQLQQALGELQQRPLNHLSWLGLNQTEILRQQIQATYNHLIDTTFVLYLDQLLTTQIKTDITHNPSGLYHSLQTYLMLTEPAHLDIPFVKDWLAHWWAKRYPHDLNAQQRMMKHFNALLQSHPAPWPIDYALVNAAQAELKKRPLVEIAFAELQSEYDGLSAPSWEGEKINDLNTSANVPALYSTDHFKYIYNVKIPYLASVIEKGNWVMGENEEYFPNAEIAHTLTQQLQAAYLQHYIAQWTSVLKQWILIPPNTLNDAIKEINVLSDEHSPVWQALNLVVNEVPTTNNSLHSLHEFLNKNETYQTMQSTLKNLYLYLQTVTTAPDGIKTAYDTAANRMQDNGANDPMTAALTLSQQLPVPVNEWVTTIVQNSWKLLLQNSVQYLNTMWAINVLPEYHHSILHRFPIFKKARQDMSVIDFNRFFGPGGTMESFFYYYLSPFVDTSQPYWTWKNLDGEQVDIDQTKLDMLIRASMIQQMFYTINPLTPTLQFTLTPVSLSSNVKRFTLNVAGQMVVFEPGVIKGNQLRWTHSPNNFITLRFNTLSTQQPTLTLLGSWAWLHLISQSHLHMTDDPKQFQLTFTLSGNEAHYQLTTDNPISPYLPGVLFAFRCPKSL
ncbi:MAG: hypothetical protein A3F17_06745 [Gammaproteobacteria bacterium RIFCSPHIGHO2_12_FULL_41_15]|nr:MAG: hypothetical protein A3F17_06745 [Gammaproteobacteria bacterium RIFCSPHIGHO2_12_FULL_41_15]